MEALKIVLFRRFFRFGQNTAHKWTKFEGRKERKRKCNCTTCQIIICSELFDIWNVAFVQKLRSPNPSFFLLLCLCLIRTIKYKLTWMSVDSRGIPVILKSDFISSMFKNEMMFCSVIKPTKLHAFVHRKKKVVLTMDNFPVERSNTIKYLADYVTLRQN